MLLGGVVTHIDSSSAYHGTDGELDLPRMTTETGTVPRVQPASSGVGLSSSIPALLPSNATAALVGVPLPPARRRWAYAFLVAGCSDRNPGYRGFLYNVAASAQRLRDLGSTADVVVMVQMASNTDARTLPSDEERMLLDLDVHVRYLPKFRSSVHECFYASVMEKFRVLELVEYSRVLFLDADIMPLCSLDYLFDLSEPEEEEEEGGTQARRPVLKPNVLLAWNDEAANAGLFMVEPGVENWESLLQAIRRKEEHALSLEYPHWDEVVGWGHKIVAPDYWRGFNGTKITVWDWHAVFADQGLVYYWTKYVQKNVSIIVGSEVETWSSSGNGKNSSGGEVYLEGIMTDPLSNFSCPSALGFRAAPYRDIVHFTGKEKPWYFDLRGKPRVKSRGLKKKLVVWRDALLKAQTRTNFTFSLHLTKEHKNAKPPLGAYSTYYTMIRHIKAKKFFQWNHYEDPNEAGHLEISSFNPRVINR